MTSSICRACMCRINEPNDIIQIFGNDYEDKYDLSIIIPDVFKVKVGSRDFLAKLKTLRENN